MAIPALPFYCISIVVILSAISVFYATNLVHSVMRLFVMFIGMVGLFLLLRLEFIAFIQLLIFVGAIAILVVFGLMTMGNATVDKTNLRGNHTWIALGTSMLFFAALVGFLSLYLPSLPIQATGDFVTLQQLGKRLLIDDLLAFELISVVLLAVLVGVVMLLQEDKKNG